jgi:hypothetical protein
MPLRIGSGSWVPGTARFLGLARHPREPRGQRVESAIPDPVVRVVGLLAYSSETACGHLPAWKLMGLAASLDSAAACLVCALKSTRAFAVAAATAVMAAVAATTASASTPTIPTHEAASSASAPMGYPSPVLPNKPRPRPRRIVEQRGAR